MNSELDSLGLRNYCLSRNDAIYAGKGMERFGTEKFKECWSNTEVIRQYERILFTFGDMTLPYVFAAEHSRLRDRTVVRRGVVFVQRPQIVLPGGPRGPEFAEGFEHARAMPAEGVFLLRAMGLPYSRVANKVTAEEKLEYGGLQSVLDKLNEQMDGQEDTETGLIKGVLEGADVSLMRYVVGLAVKSGPENVKEFLEHMRRRRGEPIRPDERITDEDIRRLFG